MPRFLKDDRALPVEIAKERQGTNALKDVDRALTAPEAVEEYTRGRARALWEMGTTSFTDLSKIFQVPVPTLKRWAEIEEWPDAATVAAQNKENQEDLVRRARRQMHLKHIVKQDQLIDKGYELLAEAEKNIPLARDPVKAATSIVKSAATLGKHFTEISGLNQTAEKAKGPQSNINLNFLTAPATKTVDGEGGQAPYGEP